jgi:signal transduction histidine kinase
MLERVGTLVDLALQRAALFEQERVSRRHAEAASAELETLLYSVSHDLRSPLISVLGYLDVLRQEHADALTGEGPHYLDRISVNAVYMQSLISDLLELSRIGRNDPAPQRLDLHVLAEQVLEAARMSHPRAQLALDGQLPVVVMSDVRVRQLLTNLVDNALKHGGRDDLTLTIGAGTGATGDLLIRVADDGRGVPPEYRERVLRVFERLDAARATSGTGMGLAICKRIVESFGGRLALDGPSGGATTGTTITIELPVDVVADPGLPSPRTPEHVENAVKEMT